MTGKEYLLRFQYQLDLVAQIKDKLNAARNAKTSRLDPNNVSIEHSNTIQRTSEDVAVLQERYNRELDILHNMRMDLLRLVSKISDNKIAAYLMARYCRGQSAERISKDFKHTVKWLDSKAAEILNPLIQADSKTFLTDV